MKRIAFLYYRDWAWKLIGHVQGSVERLNVALYPFTSLPDLQGFARGGASFPNLSLDDMDAVILVGWSEIVPLEFYKDRLVLVLHPSPLPRYRGGSPIQHQIINGETMSAVTLFRLDPAYPAVDSGPIYGALPYSLEGNLSDVLDRIATVGARLVTRAIEDLEMGALTFTPQNEAHAMIALKRRKPEQSELTQEDFSPFVHGHYVHNMVRALQDPYPNAFFQFDDGRLYITQTRWEPK